MDFENHLLTWLASIFCCAGVISIAISRLPESSPIYKSNLFLPTYTVGIVAWLLHGIEADSLAIIIPCSIQIVALVYLLYKLVSYRVGNNTNEL